ncbi:MAG: DUF4214 domain-containing protein [Lachnospiraceae bacterium]|nr:DUF4214 domain-containing protein [Lachnospiraceae bacterium]
MKKNKFYRGIVALGISLALMAPAPQIYAAQSGVIGDAVYEETSIYDEPTTYGDSVTYEETAEYAESGVYEETTDNLGSRTLVENIPVISDGSTDTFEVGKQYNIEAIRQPKEVESQSAGDVNDSLDEVDTKNAVTMECLTGDSGAEGFVTRMYRLILGREPDEEGYRFWVNTLTTHQKAAANIVMDFFFSSEYVNLKKSNSAKVTDMYAAMLDRNPDQGGYEYWLNHLEIGMTPKSIIGGFLASPEFKKLCAGYGIDNGTVILTDARDKNYEITYFVYRLYVNCLGRKPDLSGLDNWCDYLISGRSGTELAKEFVFSKEYKAKHVDNDEFVDMLYYTILGRTPDAGGKFGWTEQLDYYHTREYVLNGFMFSTEFSKQCAQAGIKVGNSIAQPDEGTAWKYNVEILRLCNEERAANGLPKLRTREDFWEDVAMVRAVEIASVFSHDRPDGSSCFNLYKEKGYKSRRSAENIAAGYSGPQAVVTGWMNSSGHRSNILSQCEILVTGYYYDSKSAYKKYYCQNFMTPM